MSERVLPHNLDAERAVLGAVLIEPTVLGLVGLAPEDFFRDAHGRIWGAMQTLERTGTAPEYLAVIDALRRTGDLERVGGVVYLSELVDGVPRAAHVETYAGIVAAHAARRLRVLKARAEEAAAYADDDADAQAALEAAERRLAALERRTASGSLDAAGQVAALTADLARDQAGPLVYLGLPAIDQALGGIRPGEVCQVWARPGIGKTLVLCHALTVLVEWLETVCFSLEMPAAQIVRRLARMAFGISGAGLRDRFDPAAYEARFAPLVLDATPGLTVPQMAARVQRAQAGGRSVRVVCLDHLGLVGGDRTMTTYDRVSLQAREIKELAKRLDVAVIVLVQVNRDAGGDGSRELHLGSARDSGVVEETADYIVALRRLDRSVTLSQLERERYRDVLFAKILKHRHGGTDGAETAYRIDGGTLQLREDPHCKPEASDIAAVAARAGRR